MHCDCFVECVCVCTGSADWLRLITSVILLSSNTKLAWLIISLDIVRKHASKACYKKYKMHNNCSPHNNFWIIWYSCSSSHLRHKLFVCSHLTVRVNPVYLPCSVKNVLHLPNYYGYSCLICRWITSIHVNIAPLNGQKPSRHYITDYIIQSSNALSFHPPDSANIHLSSLRSLCCNSRWKICKCVWKCNVQYLFLNCGAVPASANVSVLPRSFAPSLFLINRRLYVFTAGDFSCWSNDV